MKLFATVLSILGLCAVSQGANPMVIVETSHGTIKFELFEDKSPITVKNFLEYVDAKHYDGTVFHRVIADFMIQGGGLDEKFNEKPTRAPIKNEAGNGLSNKRGTIAMARTSEPDSATAQFFINTVDNDFLDRNAGSAGYAVFGKVVEGMDVVEKIRKVKTARTRVSEGQPVEAVVIKSMRRETK